MILLLRRLAQSAGEGGGLRIHRQFLNTPPNQCLGYDTKQSAGNIPVMLEH